MTLPALQVVYAGDNCIFPSDDELIASLARDRRASTASPCPATTTASPPTTAATSRRTSWPTGSPRLA